MDNQRVAIVTGAAGDLGKYIARRLASDGLAVACNDLVEQYDALKVLVSEITSEGCRAVAVPADISIESDVEKMVGVVARGLESVDVIVCNVGIFKALSIDQMDEKVRDSIFSVNVKGTMLCYKWAARQMFKQGKGGKLIAGCSVAGLTGAPLCSAYCASYPSLAMEYARYGITANAYAPGFIGGTRMCMLTQPKSLFCDKDVNLAGIELAEGADTALGLPSGGFEAHSLSNVIKLGKLGRPEDIAGLVSFLASTAVRNSDTSSRLRYF